MAKIPAPKLIESLVPRFQALANELVDNFRKPDSCEFMSEFAEPYAARVIAIMLGLPEEEWPIIAKEATTIGLALSVTVREELPRIEASLARLYDYADALVADRVANPKDDFVSALVNASRAEDGKLSHDELRDGLVLLVFGGYDTTRNQIGLAMSKFIENPKQWQILGDHPEYARQAVEEAMRVRPTTTWVTREALEDFSYKDLEIKKGTTIHMFAESAGTDPAVFPDEFDITIKRPPHYGFGAGAHHCLGHFIARGDMTEALRILAHRIRNPRYAGDPEWLPDSGNTGPITLPIAFDPET